MALTFVRATRPLAVVASLALLAGCTTTVTGSGRSALPLRTATGSPTGSSTGTGTGSPAGADPLQVWNDVHDAVVDLPGVLVSGTFSGAAFGPTATGEATILAEYGSDGDDPVANVEVRTGGQTIEVRATGGTAWAKASAAFLTAYGYTAAEAAKAAGKWAVLTDDDSGIDVLASLDAFLQICGPDDDTDDLTAAAGSSGQVVLSSATDGGSLTVTTDPARIVSSRYTGDDLRFSYPGTTVTVVPPAAAEVVTIPDF